MSNQLEQLKEMTVVVADTGEFEQIQQYQPRDATTNPSLILAAANKPPYQFLIEEAIKWGTAKGENRDDQLKLTMEKLYVNFGVEILKLIPGRVSTEVDARLSFDVKGSIDKAKRLIALYESMGIHKERILIKLASTWEGIEAAKQLQKEGIQCNMTLLFTLEQAIACAKRAKATLISPFVGRILDWHVKHHPEQASFQADDDPGVKTVTSIYNYYKNKGFKTLIMGASFRNVDEILALAGCDLLTIAPHFLSELKKRENRISLKLSETYAKKKSIPTIKVDESRFRWAICSNAMACEKLYEGIRRFSEDALALEKMLVSRM